MKKKLVLVIIAIVGIILFLENVCKISVFDSIKQIVERQYQMIDNEENSKNDDITTVDVTNLETGSNLNHKHILKTAYNNAEHWNECTVCHEKQDIINHQFEIKWKLGYESCEENNGYTKMCLCGYKEIGHKPCVWDGKSLISHIGYIHMEGDKYVPDEYIPTHTRKCIICGNHIFHSYYMNKYETGLLYYVTLGKNGNYAERCKEKSGKNLNCTNIGDCYGCGHKVKEHASYRMDLNKGILVCEGCSLKVGTITYEHNIDNATPALNTITINLRVDEPTVLTSFKEGSITYPDVQNNTQIFKQEVSNLSEDKRSCTITLKVKFKSNVKSLNHFENVFYLNNFPIYMEGIYIYPDKIKPEITEIISSNNTELTEWSQNKPIVIHGTENYCDNVNIKIVEVDNENNIIFSGQAEVKNKQFEISCIPQLELEALEKKYKCIVTDTCENSTSQEFTISKIDIMPPTPISGTEIDGEWSKSKKFTFIATDNGVGNVSIAFNNIEDFKLANTNEDRYSRDYEFIGDLYQAKEFSVLYQDELGNNQIQKITIDKLDNTAPTITKVIINNNVVRVEANDIKEGLGEGSGVVKYRYITSAEKLDNPIVSSRIEINVNEKIMIDKIYQVKYIYIEAEDLVGNVSDVYEIKVPELILTSKVDLNLADGKGGIVLEWSSYDITDKYFVIYRREENQSDWEEIVSLDNKLCDNKYIDILANDKNKPTVPTIIINGDVENNDIKIESNSMDNGNTYSYYIEAYDINGTLLQISK